jgi:small redox-active disulfide protein 2
MLKLQILGVGCPKCDRLLQNARQAAAESSVPCEIEKVTDIVEMLSFNALSLPALAVNGEVKVAGRVPTAEEIKPFLAAAKGGGS